MASEPTHAPAPPPYTWRTFVLFFALALVVGVAVSQVLRNWLPENVARGAGGGAAIPILLSGNARWREPRVLPWVVLLVVVMAVVGGVAAR